MRQPQTTFIGLSLFGVLACGGGSDLGPTDETLTFGILAGDGQNATVGEPTTTPLTVQVVTANDEPRSGLSIAFAVQGGEATLSSTQAVTDQAGTASVGLTIGGRAGAVEVVASGTGLQGSPVTFHILANPAAPAALTAAGGNGQNGFLGRPFPEPVSARLTDRFGNPTQGIDVTWVVESGGGSVSPETATTDAGGLVEASWTAGPQPGENLLSVAVGASPTLVYSATGVSPGTGRIAISPWGLAIGEGLIGIHIMQPDGTELTPLPNPGSGDRNPVWSPDGSRIAFNTNRFGGVEFAVMKLDGSDLVRVAPMPDGAYAEALGWSPDGTRVLFTSDVDVPNGVSGLYVAKADGSGTRQVIPNTEGAFGADWSPDGQRIVFAGLDTLGDYGGIHVISVDGSGLRQVAFGENPQWSPDGSKIGFSAYHPEGGYQPSLMNPDGTGLVPFPGTTRTDGRPQLNFLCWSPDGEKVLLSGNPGSLDDDDDEFYSMNVDGTGLLRITYDGVFTLGGSWGP